MFLMTMSTKQTEYAAIRGLNSSMKIWLTIVAGTDNNKTPRWGMGEVFH